MSRRDVFYVAIIEPTLTPSRWVVKGRAYELIHAGETVKYDPAEKRDAARPLSFRVEGIRSYGHDLEVLYPPMTGDLLLQGSDGQLITEHSALYIED